MNPSVSLFFGGIVILAIFVMFSLYSLKRTEAKQLKTQDTDAVAAELVWTYMTQGQKEEFFELELLVDQEEWILHNIDASVLNGVSPEKVLIHLANRNFILLGKGPFTRHASASHLINVNQAHHDSKGTMKTENVNEVEDEEVEIEDSSSSDTGAEETSSVVPDNALADEKQARVAEESEKDGKELESEIDRVSAEDDPRTKNK